MQPTPSSQAGGVPATQPPAVHFSAPSQKRPLSHMASFVAWAQAFAASSHESTVQATLSSQLGGLPATQTPATHVSAPSQKRPLSHSALLAQGGVPLDDDELLLAVAVPPDPPPPVLDPVVPPVPPVLDPVVPPVPPMPEEVEEEDVVDEDDPVVPPVPPAPVPDDDDVVPDDEVLDVESVLDVLPVPVPLPQPNKTAAQIANR